MVHRLNGMQFVSDRRRLTCEKPVWIIFSNFLNSLNYISSSWFSNSAKFAIIWWLKSATQCDWGDPALIVAREKDSFELKGKKSRFRVFLSQFVVCYAIIVILLIFFIRSVVRISENYPASFQNILFSGQSEISRLRMSDAIRSTLPRPCSKSGSKVRTTTPSRCCRFSSGA